MLSSVGRDGVEEGGIQVGWKGGMEGEVGKEVGREE